MKITSWNNAINQERAALVFENRNKEYGAFEIRKNYEKLLVRSFLITRAAIVLAVSIPVIINLISNSSRIYTGNATIRHRRLR